MRRFLLLTIPLAALVLATRAKADPITYNLSFTAAGEVAASGSFTVTFDPTKTYRNTTTGLVVNSFSDTFTPPTDIGFSYAGQAQ